MDNTPTREWAIDHGIRGQLPKAGDRGAAEIASRQHGVVSHGQLVAVGITPRAIEWRVGVGRLYAMRRGVYAVGHPRTDSLAVAAAAILACGEGAVLSHGSAAALWGLIDPPDVVAVTLVGRDCGAKPGIRRRRVARLSATDLEVRSDLPVTAPARTLLDLAQVMTQRQLRRAVDEAVVQRLVDEDALVAVLERYPGRRGAKRLRQLLQARQGPSLTRSEAERRLLEVLEAHDLPRPETNVRLGRFEVDLLWRAERLVVEVDGYAFHGTRTAFERDRERDAELQAARFAVARVTWRQIVDAPGVTANRIARLLDRD